MKNLLIFIFVLQTLFIHAAEPVFMREVTIGGNSQIPAMVKLEFYMPASCKGYKLMSRHSKEYAFTEYFRSDSLVKIFFKARPGKKLHLVFYKDKVKQPEQKQESGVLRRVKTFKGQNVISLRMFKRLWEAGDECGARFEGKIFSGWNPFGPKANSLHWYSAFINIPESGKWTFFSASTDASFLLIDDKLVVDSPGRKWIKDGLEGKIRATIDIQKGIHKLDYLHANNNEANCYAIAAFLPPGASKKKLKVIPESFYTPVITAIAGPLQTFNRKITCDFSWEILDVIDINELKMYVVRFQTPFKKFLHWSLALKAPEFNYFYFKPGTYTIELKNNLGEVTQDVKVCDQYMLKPISNKKVKQFIMEAIEQEKTVGIQPEGYAFLASALVKLEMNEEAEKFYNQLLKKQQAVPPDTTFTLFNDLVLNDLLKKEKYNEAEKQLNHLSGLIKSANLLSVANLSSACLQFYCSGNIPKAEKYFAKIKRENLPSDALLFKYDLLKADMTLMNKDLEKASLIYRQIKPVSEVTSKRPELVMSGTMIAIQNCYVLKDYETAMEHCERLEASFPVVRLQPDYLLLKAKILKELKQPQRAMNLLLRLLKTDPTQKTAANANWEIAQFYYKDKQYSAAEKRLNDILTEAPRSREAAESAVLLEKLKRELRR